MAEQIQEQREAVSDEAIRVQIDRSELTDGQICGILESLSSELCKRRRIRENSKETKLWLLSDSERSELEFATEAQKGD